MRRISSGWSSAPCRPSAASTCSSGTRAARRPARPPRSPTSGSRRRSSSCSAPPSGWCACVSLTCERAKRAGVICITSAAVKEPTPHLALSNTIRPAVTGWAKTLSRELGPDGITVNCVAPGRIDTPRMSELYGPDGPPAAELAQIPIGRMGTPREFGDVVCFLASARAGYVTGTTVQVDGGISRSLL